MRKEAENRLKAQFRCLCGLARRRLTLGGFGGVIFCGMICHGQPVRLTTNLLSDCSKLAPTPLPQYLSEPYIHKVRPKTARVTHSSICAGRLVERYFFNSRA
jgi:hypothetical protein